MPPANTPLPGSPHLSVSQSTTRTPSPSSVLPVLRGFNSEVLDLASTLTTPAEDDVEAQNISFLQTPMDAAEDEVGAGSRSLDREVRNERRRQVQRRERSLSQDAREQRRLRDRHLRALVAPFPRTPAEEAMRNNRQSSHAPYGDHVPSQQSLYDWAPATEENEEAELEELVTGLRQQQPSTHPDILRVLARAQLESDRELHARASAAPSPSSSRQHPSLRSAAILQSVRRNRQFSERSSTEWLQRDRQRTEPQVQTGQAADETMSGARSTSRDHPQPIQESVNAIEARNGERQRSIHARVSNSDQPPSNPATSARSRDPSAAAPNSTLNTRNHGGNPVSEQPYESPSYIPPSVQDAVSRSLDREWVLSLQEAEVTGRRRIAMQRHAAREEARAAGIAHDSSTEAPSRGQAHQAMMAQFDALAAQSERRLRQNRTTRAPPQTLHHPPSHHDALNAFRRQYMGEEDGGVSSVPSKFERVIKFLAALRSPDIEYSKLFEEASASAREPEAVQDRINVPSDPQTGLRIQHSAPPAPTSWLAPGMVFAGHQRAASVVSSTSSTTLYRMAHSAATNSTTEVNTTIHAPYISPAGAIPGYEPLGPSADMLSHSRPHQATNLSSRIGSTQTQPQSRDSTQDKWTVKVVVHAVDYDEMKLQGTMEAYNVPSYSSSSIRAYQRDGEPPTESKTTFATYVEGELIDFVKNSLLTDSFKSSPDVDALYWRKLEPFSKLSDQEIAHGLLSPKWIQEELAEKYVLMRWKEKCFVKGTLSTVSGDTQVQAEQSGSSSGPAIITATDVANLAARNGTGDTADTGNGFGLSISGFYYVSMRRSDGKCDGLYFDPQSSPYQYLELKPEGGGMWTSGSIEFR